MDVDNLQRIFKTHLVNSSRAHQTWRMKDVGVLAGVTKHFEGVTLFPDKRMKFNFGRAQWLQFHFWTRIKDKIILSWIKG